MSAKNQRKHLMAARSRERQSARKNKAEDQKGEIDDQDMGWRIGEGYWIWVKAKESGDLTWIEPRVTLSEWNADQTKEPDTCQCGR